MKTRGGAVKGAVMVALRSLIRTFSGYGISYCEERGYDYNIHYKSLGETCSSIRRIGLSYVFWFGTVALTIPSSIGFSQVESSCLNCSAKPDISLQVIAQIESSSQPNAVGDGGKALGLYQLHEAVIIDYNKRNKTSYSHKDALRPDIAAKIADWYLNTEIPRLLRHFSKKNPAIKDTIQNRLISYNCGIGCVVKGRFPAVTKAYLKKYEKIALIEANSK